MVKSQPLLGKQNIITPQSEIRRKRHHQVQAHLEKFHNKMAKRDPLKFFTQICLLQGKKIFQDWFNQFFVLEKAGDFLTTAMKHYFLFFLNERNAPGGWKKTGLGGKTIERAYLKHKNVSDNSYKRPFC
ncbi:MAG: hypothetical protein ACD_56C00157G0002 [uncultured bacterium]|nr:MAG: hypothetical protein ACD_56C00157G0002 [uncultured bacterium]